MATIGSNNGVSHNHNDVGSYMLYLDSTPVLIDVGVGTYTKETFSRNRYILWNMQSQWHNLPIINGIQQKDGRSYHAEDVEYITNNETAQYRVNVAKAYPKEAAVQSWIRTIKMHAGNNEIRVAEQYQLEEFKKPQSISFISKIKPQLLMDGFFLQLDNGKKVFINFERETVTFSLETKEIEDPRLIKVWGGMLYKMNVLIKSMELRNQVIYKIIAN